MMGGDVRILSAAVFFPTLLLGLGLFTRKAKRASLLMIALAFLVGFGMLSGCVSNPTQELIMPTPTGTSTVTVTMMGPNSVTQTIPLTLTVIASAPVTAHVAYPREGTSKGFAPESTLASSLLLAAQPLR